MTHLADAAFASFLNHLGFPGGSVVKNPSVIAGEEGFHPGSGRYPGGRNGNPLQSLLPGKSHGQRRLVGYSLWGRKRVRHD